MKAIQGILLLTGCLFAWSCNQTPYTPQPPTPPVASPTIASSPPPVVGGSAVAEAGDTSAPTFEGTLGVTSKPHAVQPPAILKAVRSGRHDNFDRVVFEFAENRLPGYRIEYANTPVRNCGPGEVVTVAGNSALVIQISPAQAHNEAGESTVAPRDRVLNLPVLKELKLICDFEADLQFVLGVAPRNPYRVLELSNPGRLVVDIRH